MAAAAIVLAVVLGFGLHALVGRAGSGSVTTAQGGSGGSGFSLSPPPVDPSSASTPEASTSSVLDDTPSVTATSSEAEQAAAVEALLDTSASGRNLVGPAVLALSACDGSADPSQAAASIDRARQNRENLLTALEPIAVDALPNGPTLKNLLHQAWTQSLTADRLYLQWARSIQAGSPCNPSASSKAAADAASSQASQAKASFVNAWNAGVAVPLNLVQRQEKDL